MCAFFNQYSPNRFGWSVDPSQIVAFHYRGEPFPSGVHRLVAPIFTGLLDDLVAAGLHVPSTGKPNVDGNWGADVRAVRGQSTLSFHAYGLAIDIDAPHNPMTYAAGWGTMPHSSPRLAAKWGCEWGGDWSGRRDLMHWECHLAPREIAGVLAANGHHSTAGNATEVDVLRLGSTGSAVGALQRRLNQRPAAHPQFGPRTEAAVKQYQERHRLHVDGVVGPATKKTLDTANILPGERVVQLGNTGADVGWLQRRLHLTPAPHPAFGPKTLSAVKTWQQRAGLTATGVVDEKTWKKLGAFG